MGVLLLALFSLQPSATAQPGGPALGLCLGQPGGGQEPPIEQRIMELLREGLEGGELADRLTRLGPQATAPIAQQLVREAGRGGASGPAMGDALTRLDTRASLPILLGALRDPATPASARRDIADVLLRMDALGESAVGDEALPPELRLAVAERLYQRGELAPLEQVLSSLGQIRRDDPSLTARAEALESGLRWREEPASSVTDVPEPEAPVRAPALPVRRRSGDDAPPAGGTLHVNLLLGFGAVALAAVLLATRRRA